MESQPLVTGISIMITMCISTFQICERLRRIALPLKDARSNICCIRKLHESDNSDSESCWAKLGRVHVRNISTLTDERLERLQSIGFRWAKRRGQVRWDEKYDELIQYANKVGNCHVPTKFKENTALGRWVSTQRAEYKTFCKGETSSLTAEKIRRLDSIGFAWFMAL